MALSYRVLTDPASELRISAVRFRLPGISTAATGKVSPGFAWFSTVTDSFLFFDGEQVWENWEDFENSYNADEHNDKLERYAGLFKYGKKDIGVLNE